MKQQSNLVYNLVSTMMVLWFLLFQFWQTVFSKDSCTTVDFRSSVLIHMRLTFLRQCQSLTPERSLYAYTYPFLMPHSGGHKYMSPSAEYNNVWLLKLDHKRHKRNCLSQVDCCLWTRGLNGGKWHPLANSTNLSHEIDALAKDPPASVKPLDKGSP